MDLSRVKTGGGIGVAVRWRAFDKRACKPGGAQSEHVAEVVPGVRDQRDRVGMEPKGRLDDYKSEIKRDAETERHAKVAGLAAVRMPMARLMLMMGVARGASVHDGSLCKGDCCFATASSSRSSSMPCGSICAVASTMPGSRSWIAVSVASPMAWPASMVRPGSTSR